MSVPFIQLALNKLYGRSQILIVLGRFGGLNVANLVVDRLGSREPMKKRGEGRVGGNDKDVNWSAHDRHKQQGLI